MGNSSKSRRRNLIKRRRRMESQDYEHYRNLTLMFFLEKLVDKGGENSFTVLYFTVLSLLHSTAIIELTVLTILYCTVL